MFNCLSDNKIFTQKCVDLSNLNDIKDDKYFLELYTCDK